MKSRDDIIDEWNILHIKLVNSDREEYRNEDMADWCEKYILQAKQAYYNTDSPIIDDEAFDMLERSLRTLRPDSNVLKQVGSK